MIFIFFSLFVGFEDLQASHIASLLRTPTVFSDSTPLEPDPSNPSQQICEDISKRGCCSKHGGVCGCEGARALCCDRTVSATCPCGEGRI